LITTFDGLEIHVFNQACEHMSTISTTLFSQKTLQIIAIHSTPVISGGDSVSNEDILQFHAAFIPFDIKTIYIYPSKGEALVRYNIMKSDIEWSKLYEIETTTFLSTKQIIVVLCRICKNDLNSQSQSKLIVFQLKHSSDRSPSQVFSWQLIYELVLDRGNPIAMSSSSIDNPTTFLGHISRTVGSLTTVLSRSKSSCPQPILQLASNTKET
jgi:hypothetical protein